MADQTKVAKVQTKRYETHTTNWRGVAVLQILEDPDGAHMYINELMKAAESHHHDNNLWIPTPENPRNDGEHTPIQLMKWAFIKKEQDGNV